MNTGLSDAEYEIMQIVWETAPEPTRFAQLMQELANRGHPCHTNTLITLLGRLLRKGYLQATKIGRKNEYRPLISLEAYREQEARGFLEKHYAGSAAGLVTTLVKADMLTEDEYRMLKQILDSQAQPGT